MSALKRKRICTNRVLHGNVILITLVTLTIDGKLSLSRYLYVTVWSVVWLMFLS